MIRWIKLLIIFIFIIVKEIIKICGWYICYEKEWYVIVCKLESLKFWFMWV